jgi:amino acid transporter
VTVVRLLAIAIPLYFTWEMLQAPAFTGMPDDWLAATLVCAAATVGDAVIVLLLFGLGVLTFRDRLWFRPPRWGRYLLIVVVAVAVQAVVELVMVYRLGRWGYRSFHPLIGGIGLLPLLQPIVLLPVTWWLLCRVSGDGRGAPTA